MDKNIQVIIYRDKETGQIKFCNKMREGMTQEKVNSYNSSDRYALKCGLKAEIINIEVGSIAHYFYKEKIADIADFRREFQDIMVTLENLSRRIDETIYECDQLLKQEEQTES